MMDTFVLVNGGKVISPRLVTIREYGRWFEETFDQYTSEMELYMKAKKGKETVLESHPGTKIGKFFDKLKTSNPMLLSWYVSQDSPMMKRLVKYKMAELRDAIPISVSDTEHRNMIRVYTIEQIEFYIRSNIDSKFSIAPYIHTSKKVSVTDSDISKLIKPEITNKRSTLF